MGHEWLPAMVPDHAVTALVVFGFLAAALCHAGGGAMSDAERAYLIDRLEESRKAVLASIDGLTEAQWTFKPAPTVWSPSCPKNSPTSNPCAPRSAPMAG